MPLIQIPPNDEDRRALDGEAFLKGLLEGLTLSGSGHVAGLLGDGRDEYLKATEDHPVSSLLGQILGGSATGYGVAQALGSSRKLDTALSAIEGLMANPTSPIFGAASGGALSRAGDFIDFLRGKDVMERVDDPLKVLFPEDAIRARNAKGPPQVQVFPGETPTLFHGTSQPKGSPFRLRRETSGLESNPALMQDLMWFTPERDHAEMYTGMHPKAHDPGSEGVIHRGKAKGRIAKILDTNTWQDDKTVRRVFDEYKPDIVYLGDRDYYVVKNPASFTRGPIYGTTGGYKTYDSPTLLQDLTKRTGQDIKAGVKRTVGLPKEILAARQTKKIFDMLDENPEMSMDEVMQALKEDTITNRLMKRFRKQKPKPKKANKAESSRIMEILRNLGDDERGAIGPKTGPRETASGLLVDDNTELELYHGTVQPQGTRISRLEANEASPPYGEGYPGEENPLLRRPAIWATDVGETASAFTEPRYGQAMSDLDEGQIYEIKVKGKVVTIPWEDDELIKEAFAMNPDAIVFENRGEAMILNEDAVTIDRITDAVGEPFDD